MGSGLLCTKKGETDDGEEIILEKGGRNTAGGESPKKEQDDIEKSFENMLSNIRIENEAVYKKWQELPKFNFEKRQELALLEIKENDRSITGEIYYGFWDIIGKCREYKGIILGQDGTIIEGHFSKDALIGKCRKIYANLDIYEGNIENNLYNGEGTYLKTDGSFYKGNWKNGVPNGFGEELLANGLKYIGEFKMGEKNGKGKLIFQNGNVYEGDLKEGKPYGKGIFTKKNGERYEGEWKNGLKHGKGVIWYVDGERYEGDFENGVKQGFGKQFWPNGRTAEGIWEKGLQNGLFKLIIPKEGIYTCNFENGTPSKDAQVKPYTSALMKNAKKEEINSDLLNDGINALIS